jgi:hypothetical protein
MVDTTSRDDAGLDVDEGVPPPVSPVATAPAPPAPTAPPPQSAPTRPAAPDVRRNAKIGASTGFVVTAVTVTVGCALGGMAAPSALGLGVFVGGWGGAAFGFMLGSAISIAGDTAPGPTPAPAPVPVPDAPA